MFILHDIPEFCPKKGQQAQRLWSHLEPEELAGGGERGAAELLPLSLCLGSGWSTSSRLLPGSRDGGSPPVGALFSGYSYSQLSQV